jgi:tRNA-dihydrouridine synthase
VVESWIPTLLKHDLAAIAVHGRTLKQQYGGQADWLAIGRAAALAHQHSETLLLGNGDVRDAADAVAKVAEFGVDGALIGRGAMGNPFVFAPANSDSQPRPSIFAIALEHTQLYEKTFQKNERYSFLPMRKHLGWYVREVPNASQIRIELFQTNTSQEVAAVLEHHGLL